MTATLAIGDFSRATHLSVKTLRRYHDMGLLEPIDVDPQTGYRRYAPGQIGTAQVIRRFRDLDMPLEDIQAVLNAPDLETRNQVIAAHLARLEASLGRTQDAVASLRDLLEAPAASPSIHHRHLPATPAAAITETVQIADALVWYQGALGELAATLAAQHLEPAGPAGGVFADELFADERGQATVFVPCTQEVRPMGRVAAAGHPSGRAGHRRPPRPPRRHRPGLRSPRRLRRPARPGHRRSDPRVLPGGSDRHRRRDPVAHRSRLAHLPDPLIRGLVVTGAADYG